MFPFRQFRFGRRGWLRPWVLSLLARAPRNGAEIIDEVEKMSFGSWRPSPGSVYPLLEEMTEEGLVTKMQDGRYDLTEKGRQEVEWPFGTPIRRGSTMEGMFSDMRDYITYLEDLNRSSPEKFAANKAKIKEMSDRLSALANS